MKRGDRKFTIFLVSCMNDLPIMMVSHYKKKEIPVKRGVKTFSHVMLPFRAFRGPGPAATAARGLDLRLHACFPIGFAAGLFNDLIHH